MKIKLCSVLIILIISGCSKRITSNEVIGNWWSIKVDSSYSETYVNEVEWVYNHEDFGPFSYKYTFYSDSICIGVKKWALNVSDTSLVLSDHQEKFILYKLPLKESIFESRKDSLAYENFQEEFRKRYLSKLKIEK
ncbi:hypothetical protein [Algoriphagus aquimarinus]|uniref:Lipocalin-like domain-containing protein n=1 Tax=Algoriphagus aquimarinus TaxID=237018 RepID=A0A5C7AFK5_9BACT|nr:hypothetical protein [Algoriphagus aquimarinus]TXE04777.1 hypothetical protein ESV85_18735 [Algoriphagus aquimarinus]TXE04781.1 hypothetical protein ESV85_18760 [Algoriphagus aquimarinus]